MSKSFTLHLGGREYDIQRQGTALIINGKRYQPEFDGDAVTIGPTTHKVEIAGSRAFVDGIAYGFSTEGLEPRTSMIDAIQSTQHGGDGAVNAIMPGLIIKVLVSPGDEVKAGDVLIILEAMKMESEICSPIDGVVKEVLVEKGANVSQNQPLVTVE
jgi:biotin carboxyl carrier protein